MRILLLGDSHTVGPYGTALESMLRNAGHDVTRVGIVGVAATHYNTGKHRDLKGKWVVRVGNFDNAKAQSYDLAVVSLGTNDVTGWPISSVVTDINKLIGSLSATRKIWVSPPSFSDNAAKTYNPDFARKNLNTRVTELWNALSPAYGSNAFDSRPSTSAYVQQRDIHLLQKGGEAWAKAVFNALPLTTVATTPPPAPSTQDTSDTSLKDEGKSSPSYGPMIAGLILIGVAAWVLLPKRKPAYA